MTRYHCFRQAYRVRPAASSPRGHWLGGEAWPGAECPACERPLLVLWDLSCADPRLQREELPLFARLERVPLLYCWGCAGEVAYRIRDGRRPRVEIVAHSGEPQGEDFPYPDYPAAFERRPIALDPIPQDLQAALILDDTFGDWLTEDEVELVEQWFGALPPGPRFAQLGGIPILLQGRAEVACPDPACAQHGEDMQVLAAVWDDPGAGLPMLGRGVPDEFVQVLFHACAACATLHACNRSD